MNNVPVHICDGFDSLKQRDQKQKKEKQNVLDATRI